jgi:hypothetical protein
VRLRPLPSLIAGGLCFAYLLSYPLALGRADESHLLFEARRVFDGQIPYSEFFESLTPLSLYLVAGIYWIAGPTLLAARVGFALIEGLGGALLFHLVRRVAGLPEAVLATLLFVGLCIPVWPYASAHWISTTLGLLVAAVTLAEGWQGAARARPLIAGMLTGAAVCVQQQRGAFLALWLPLAWAVLGLGLPRGARVRQIAAATAASVAGVAVVVLAVLGHAAWRASLATLIDMVFGFALQHYGPTHSGGTAWAEVLMLTGDHLTPTWHWLLQLAPLFVVGEALLLMRGGWRARPRVDLERAALCLLALLMGLSIWYLPDFIHVSFVLPFLLIPGATLLYRLRTAAVWVRLPAGRLAVTAGAALFGLAAAWQSAANLAAAHAAAPARFDTAFGPIRGTAGTEQLYRAVDRHLVREADGRSVLYSYPNDAWLYLVLPADNATPFSALVPVMFPPEDIQRMIDVLRARRPGTVVVAVPFTTGPVGEQIIATLEQGYDVADEVDSYRVYVRRSAAPPDPARGAE